MYIEQRLLLFLKIFTIIHLVYLIWNKDLLNFVRENFLLKMREEGLEPSRGNPHRILSPERLPFRHSRFFPRLH